MSDAAAGGNGGAAPEIRKGLVGVTVDSTAVSKVMPETNALTYRGYPVQDLAGACCFEEVACLLLRGELPDRAGLDAFRADERRRRALSPDHLEVIARLPGTAHPMDSLRTAVSYLGAGSDWRRESRDDTLGRAMDLLAKIPTMIAAGHRTRKGLEPVAPDEGLSMAENFFKMCFGEVPPEEVVRAFDVSLILYAEHSFNASTFTARVIASSWSDLYSAATGAIGSLKGPLHGGANEAVMHDLLEIGEPARSEPWLRGKLARKELVMGFGHRVYKQGDSRVPTMRRALEDLAAWKGDRTWIEISGVLEDIMVGEKGIHPNLDFPTGPAYYLMGFDIELYTPIFVMSRIAGWSAHVLEQNAGNVLIRPLAAYSGVPQREVPALDAR